MMTPSPIDVPAGPSAAIAATRAVSTWLALPFDAARVQYGTAVQWGLAPRSLLASRDFEHTLVALERLTLGPLARAC
jgi:hypothetical protein